jgi:hypothetical protein
MSDGEDSGLKRDALSNLADALCEDIVNTPQQVLIREVAEDFADPRALATAFDDAANISSRVQGASNFAAPADRAMVGQSTGYPAWFPAAVISALLAPLAAILRSRIAVGALAAFAVAILVPGLYRSLVEAPLQSQAGPPAPSAPDTMPPLPRVAPLPGASDSSGIVLRAPSLPGAGQAPSAERIRIAQQELARVGCFAGGDDGELTDATRSAIRKYWASTGRPTGEIAVTEALIADIRQQGAPVCE